MKHGATGKGSLYEAGCRCTVCVGAHNAKHRELRVILINHGAEPFSASAGDRIAQLLLVPFLAPELVVVDELPDGGDDRGTGGFGSSGR